jgi:hypothetical protein
VSYRHRSQLAQVPEPRRGGDSHKRGRRESHVDRDRPHALQEPRRFGHGRGSSTLVTLTPYRVRRSTNKLG